MTTKLLIDRELLERCLPFLSDTPDLVQNGAEELAGELRAILAQPAAPAEGEAVEVVAYMDHHDTLSHDAPRTAHFALMTVAQHQRIVAQRDAKLAGVVEALLKTAKWIEELPVPTVGAAGQLVKIDAALAAAGVGDE